MERRLRYPNQLPALLVLAISRYFHTRPLEKVLIVGIWIVLSVVGEEASLMYIDARIAALKDWTVLRTRGERKIMRSGP